MKTGIYIGAKKSAIKELRKTILKILDSRADQATIRAALKSLNEGASVVGASVSNCYITDASKKGSNEGV